MSWFGNERRREETVYYQLAVDSQAVWRHLKCLGMQQPVVSLVWYQTQIRILNTLVPAAHQRPNQVPSALCRESMGCQLRCVAQSIYSLG